MRSVFILGAILAFVSQPAHAVVSSATAVRILFSSTNVTDSAWLTVTNSTSKALKGISVFQTSPNPLQLAIGASGSEVVQLILPAGITSQAALPSGPHMQPGAMFYPIPISQGAKLAIRALNSSVSAGEIQVNEFYY